MVHRLYLLALLALQLALIVKLAPPLAQALRTDALPGLAPEGLPALLQFVATGLAVAGAALALAFPGCRAAAPPACRVAPIPGLARLGRGAGTGRHVAPRRCRSPARAGADAARRHGDDRRARCPIRHRRRPGDGRGRRAVRRTAAPQCRGGRSALPDVHSGRGRIEVTHPPELRTLAPTQATGGTQRRIA